MFNYYKRIFFIRGSVKFTIGAFLARLAIPMTTLSMVIMLTDLGYGYSTGGSVVATCAISWAVIAPQISRQVDRFGQSRVLPIVSAVGGFSFLGLIVCAKLGMPLWTFFILALGMGFMPNMTAMTRARWSALYQGKPELLSAFSLESVFDEITYIIGTSLGLLLSVELFPEAGPLMALLFFVVGIIFFLRQTSTEPIIYSVKRKKLIRDSNFKHRFLFQPLFLSMMFSMLGLGIVASSVELSALAIAADLNSKKEAIIVILGYAITSCVAGLVYGSNKVKLPVELAFVYGTLGTGLTAITFIFSQNIPSLVLAVVISGLFFATTIIAIMLIVENRTPIDNLTESLTYMGTAIAMGYALGGITTGYVIDYSKAHYGLLVSLVAGFTMIINAFLGKIFLARSKNKT